MATLAGMSGFVERHQTSLGRGGRGGIPLTLSNAQWHTPCDGCIQWKTQEPLHMVVLCDIHPLCTVGQKICVWSRPLQRWVTTELCRTQEKSEPEVVGKLISYRDCFLHVKDTDR